MFQCVKRTCSKGIMISKSQLMIKLFKVSVLDMKRSCEIRWSDFAGIHPSPAGFEWNQHVRRPSGYPSPQPLCRSPRRDRIWRLMSVTGTVKGTIPNTVLSSRIQKQSLGILWSAVGQFMTEPSWLCLRKGFSDQLQQHLPSVTCAIWSFPPGYLVSWGVSEVAYLSDCVIVECHANFASRVVMLWE